MGITQMKSICNWTLSPPLKGGVTLAIFKISGKIPVANMEVNIYVIKAHTNNIAIANTYENIHNLSIFFSTCTRGTDAYLHVLYPSLKENLIMHTIRLALTYFDF